MIRTTTPMKALLRNRISNSNKRLGGILPRKGYWNAMTRPNVGSISKVLLTHLKRRHSGKVKAVHSRALEARFCVHGATIRRAVNALRRAGKPICSGPNGYYYAAGSPELWDTISRMDRRTVASARVVQGMRRAANAWPDSGQTRFADTDNDWG